MAPHEGRPVLSVELFQSIIEELAMHEPVPPWKAPNYVFERKRLRDLTTCSLVCRTFAPICRPHIFEHVVTVGATEETAESAAKLQRLLSFVSTAARSPGVLSLVHMLTLDVSLPRYWRSSGRKQKNAPQLNESNIEQVISTLSSFPNLLHLRIHSTTDFFNESDTYPKLLRSRLLEIYLAQGSLRTVRLDKIPRAITPTHLLTTPGLCNIALRCMEMPLHVGCLSDVEYLDIMFTAKESSFRFLDECPNLKTLRVGRYTMSPSTPPPQYTSNVFDASKLKQLQVTCPIRFFDFCKQRPPKDPHRLMFQDMINLDVCICCNNNLAYVSEFTALREMLKQTVSLHSITIDVSGNHPEPPRISSLDLDKRFIDGVFKSLTDFTVCMALGAAKSGWHKTLLTDLNSLFIVASKQNALERIMITMNIADISQDDIQSLIRPPLPALASLKRTLDCGLSFPALQKVEFYFSFLSLYPRQVKVDRNQYIQSSRVEIRNKVISIDPLDTKCWVEWSATHY